MKKRCDCRRRRVGGVAVEKHKLRVMFCLKGMRGKSFRIYLYTEM